MYTSTSQDLDKALFLGVDAYSKWLCVSILQSTTVEKTIDELRQLFATYDILEQIVSNNGLQFTIHHIHEDELHTTHSNCTNHPATNGLAEQFVQSLKYGLKASPSSGLSLSRRMQLLDDVLKCGTLHHRSHLEFVVLELRVEKPI